MKMLDSDASDDRQKCRIQTPQVLTTMAYSDAWMINKDGKQEWWSILLLTIKKSTQKDKPPAKLYQWLYVRLHFSIKWSTIMREKIAQKSLEVSRCGSLSVNWYTIVQMDSDTIVQAALNILGHLSQYILVCAPLNDRMCELRHGTYSLPLHCER